MRVTLGKGQVRGSINTFLSNVWYLRCFSDNDYHTVIHDGFIFYDQ